MASGVFRIGFFGGLAAGVTLGLAAAGAASGAGSLSGLFSPKAGGYEFPGTNVRAASIDAPQLAPGAVTDVKFAGVSWTKVTGGLVTGSVSGVARTANSGNFGVGTASPAEKLEVAGKVKASAVKAPCVGLNC